MNSEFVHLHVHTQYSLLDGAIRINDIFEECRRLGMRAVAMTDHGNMYGAVDFFKRARSTWEKEVKKLKFPAFKQLQAELGNEVSIDDTPVDFAKDMMVPEYAALYVKPIIGSEFYLCQQHTARVFKEELHHLVLLAKDEQGYKNLMKLSSLSFTEGFYGKPRIDFEQLEKYHEGLICLTACLAGEIPCALKRNNYPLAKEITLRYQALFGEDLYLELQHHDNPEDNIVVSGLIRLSKELGIPMVATNDCHYLKREDAEAQDVLLCINTNSILSDPDRFKFNNESYYLKSAEEMDALFGEIDGALSNSLIIADKCNVEIKFHLPLLPEYKLPPEYEDEDRAKGCERLLRDKTAEGLKKKYKERFFTDEIQDRMEYELSVIIRCNFVDYFLIVWDFVNYSKSIDVPVGPGRGSGAGSIVAYGLGITDIDPLRYGLFFERFLNPERKSNPDFDIDFCPEGREKIHQYVIDLYGENNVCQIITFGTLATRSVLKDVGKVYDIPFVERNEMTKLMDTVTKGGKTPPLQNIFFEHYEKDDKDNVKLVPPLVPELVELYNNNDVIHKVVDIAMRLEGIPKSTGMHAAGVVICGKQLDNYIPLQMQAKEHSVTTQFTKDTVEELGLLKMDFLALITLTDIAKAIKYVKKTHGITLDFDEIGCDDPNIYRMISIGDVVGVFQLESEGMKNCMAKLKPNSLEDITAGISLFRPGPMEAIPKYIKNKENPDSIEYDVPELKDILGVTYGVMVYQEQVMQIVQKLAGFSLARADNVRRIMSKKKLKEMAKQKNIFINGCVKSKEGAAVDGTNKRGINQAVAEKLFAEMESFASYAFNKSHAAAYAVLSYRTAYLKYYYEKEFYTAIINNRITSKDDRTRYVAYLLVRQIPLYAPDINKSNVYFEVEGEGIRYGLLGIKNVGIEGLKSIIEVRESNGEFTDIFDFFKRVDTKAVNKRMIESLIKAGAFDCFKETRATMLSNYELIMSVYAKEKKDFSSGQLSLFMLDEDDGGIDMDNQIEITRLREQDKMLLLADEKEMLGIYYSDHPLNDYKDLYQSIPFTTKDIVRQTRTEDEEFDGEQDLGIAEQMVDRNVSMAGQITNITKKQMKNGGVLILGELEDIYGMVPVRLSDKACNNYQIKGGIIKDGIIVKIEGRLSYRDGNPSVSIMQMDPFEKKKKQKKCYLLLRFNLGEDILFNKAYERLALSKGNCPVYVSRNEQICQIPLTVEPNETLLADLADIIGAERIVYKEKEID